MSSVRGIPLGGAWTPAEKSELDAALSVLPPAWLEDNPCLRSFVRRDVLRDAPAGAPGHSMYDDGARAIVLFDKGLYKGDRLDPTQLRRSVYHELAHALLRRHRGLLSLWERAGSGDGFVDAYARTALDEDFCDTFSEYLIAPDATRRVAPKKAHFMKRLLAGERASEEKTAMAFIEAFADELTKAAASEGMLHRLGGRLPAIARMAAVGGGAAAVGHAVGKRSGEREGIEEGTSLTGDVAQRAYRAGVQRGALAMRDAMMDAGRSKPEAT